MAGKTLDPAKIAATAERLSKRIFERFPDAGLYEISKELMQLGEQARRDAPMIAKPMYPVRVAVGVLIALILAICSSLIWLGIQQVHQIDGANMTEIVGALEAATNELVLIGLAVFFLINIETRIKRAKSIRAIHELRSIAHVIDMHQLSKDPAYFFQYSGMTASSPNRRLTLPELMRYLDYCSEMLSLTSKTAALYVQRFNDAVVLNAVSDVETLCTGLSRKIWQKLQIAESVAAESGFKALRTMQPKIEPNETA